MIHTLLIHSAFTVPNEPGGTRHFEIAQSLTHCGERFSVITSNTGYLNGKRKHRSKKWVIQKKCEGVHVFYVNAHSLLHKNYVARVFAFLSFALNALIAAFTVRSVDVVMGTSPPIFQAFSAWLVSRLRRVPFLLEIRDLWPEFAIHMRVLKNPIFT